MILSGQAVFYRGFSFFLFLVSIVFKKKKKERHKVEMFLLVVPYYFYFVIKLFLAAPERNFVSTSGLVRKDSEMKVFFTCG